MQRVSATRSGSVRRDRQIRRSLRDEDRRPCGTAPAPGIATLAPSFTQSLPSLEGIASEYNQELHGELLYELCAALTRYGLGTPESWRRCGENAILFARNAVVRGIGQERFDPIQRNVEYHLHISDRPDQEVSLDQGQLIITIESCGCGYLKIGPAIEALEQEAVGLGAAFYWELTFALYAVMRLYNHVDALMYEERLKEYAEMDDKASQAQYEFPGVEEALPYAIRATLKRDDTNWRLKSRGLLQSHREGTYRAWIEGLMRIQRFCRLRIPSSPDPNDNGYYDQPPLPSLLVAFRDHDAIVACFDEESQHMLEGSFEPTLSVIFAPANRQEVQTAIRTVARFVAVICEVCVMTEMLKEWEDTHGDTT